MKRILIFWIGIVILLRLGAWPLQIAAAAGQPAPESAQEHYYQGVFYGKQGKYEEAIMELEKALALQPAYADAYNALGIVYHYQKEPQKAMQQYLAAIETNPQHVKARLNLATLYKEQGDYQKAMQQLEKALEFDPRSELARNLIGEIRPKAEAQAAKEQAAQALARQQAEAQRLAAPPAVLATPPKTPSKSAQALFAAGTKLIRQGKLAAGIQEYQKGLKSQPQSAEGQTLLAMAYREKYRLTNESKWRQAEIAAFHKALRTDPQYVPALLGLGETLYEQGEPANARPYFRKVLQYAPNHPARAELEAILGQTP